MLLSLSPELTLVSFAASGGGLILIRVAKKYLKKYSTRMQEAMANYTSTLSESVGGIKLIKAFNAQRVSARKFQEETEYYVTSALKHRKVVALVPSVYEMIAIFALCFVLYMGGNKVLVEGSMSSSDLLTFLFLLFSIMAPLTILINNIAEMQRGLVATERVMKVLDLQPHVKDGGRALASFERDIKVDDLVFAYDEGPDVLRGVRLEFRKGEKIAFVGSSGSGKSTMLDLLLRFYDPKSGSISIDGIDIRDLTLESYLTHFGVVSQENILFNDNVRNNILFGAAGISDEEIWEALKIANAYDFVKRLPQGLDTLLGERGMTISGGERQRLAIARAVIRKPEILMFDEATSALDAESEHIVQSAINHSLAGRTAVIVAHRLATITSCDRIYVFDKGKIVETGTHAELIERHGIYRTLYDMQSLDKG
jgi:subfamily B ATP-binding cassette protein MsbA